MSPDTTSDASLANRAFEAALEVVGGVAPEVATAIRSELEDQRHALKLIASENYSSPAVQLAMGQWMTDKYAEGAAGKRWYAGCENVDTVEGAAASLARELVGAGPRVRAAAQWRRRRPRRLLGDPRRARGEAVPR